MTKLTKFISMTFPAGAASRTTAQISIPFKVKTIHIKSAGYTAGTPGGPGATNYVAVMSDLVVNNPIAILNQDTTYSSATVQDIEHELYNPTDVNGTFNFWLVNMDNTPATATVNNDKVGLVIEFNSPDVVF
jgi:hypothetical protein